MLEKNSKNVIPEANLVRGVLRRLELGHGVCMSFYLNGVFKKRHCVVKKRASLKQNQLSNSVWNVGKFYKRPMLRQVIAFHNSSAKQSHQLPSTAI